VADLVRMAHATITAPKYLPAAVRDFKRCLLIILNAWDDGSVAAALWRQSHNEDKVAAGQANKVGEARRCAPNVVPLGDEVVESSEMAC
jgi:predicted O-methyltransferase YrrM